jgi:predicted RNA-binding Zn ribbon-like protein
MLAPRIDLCLDFANTVSWRGSKPEESLNSLADVLRWCDTAGAQSKRSVREHAAMLQNDSTLTAELFSEAIAIREAIYRIFYCAASGLPARDGDLLHLNEALKRAPMRTSVERIGAGFGWRVERTGPAAATLLAPVLWSAADLLVGPNLARVRHCANDRCLWLFLDDSKTGTRRWCSMQSCGNRAKAHRHYLRQKRKRTDSRKSALSRR